MNNVFQTLAHFQWERLPVAVRRFSPLQAAILSDGRYLSRVAGLSVLLAVSAVALGFHIGSDRPLWIGFTDYLLVTHNNHVFSCSLPFIILAMAIGGMSAQLGFWFVAGFVVGDLVGFQEPPPQEALGFYAGLAISYILLWQLVCLVPVMARVLTAACVGGLSPVTARGKAALKVIALCVGVMMIGLLTYAWIVAFPWLIRPAFVFTGEWIDTTLYIDPRIPVESIEVVQRDYRRPLFWTHPILLWACGIFVVRIIVEHLWRPEPERAGHDEASREKPITLPGWLRILIRSAFLTFLLAGLCIFWVHAALLFVVLLVLFTVLENGTVLPENVSGRIARVPFALRFAGAIFATIAITDQLMPFLAYDGVNHKSLFPLIVTIPINMLIFGLLLMPRGTRQEKSA